MSDNMKLWDKVCTTDPSHTKKVNFGRAITAIDPYRQIENATREFGSAGKGWGWEVKKVEYTSTNEVAILISLWHGEENTCGGVEQWGQASLFIDKAEKKKDGDCFKKATTDGITKCLSYLGFNADVFLGKFDDNKYVQNLKDKKVEEGICKKRKFMSSVTSLLGNTVPKDGLEWQNYIRGLADGINEKIVKISDVDENSELWDKLTEESVRVVVSNA